MKHLKNRKILCVMAMLVLTVALTAVYGTIGLRSDIRYEKKQCVEKMDSLTASVAEIMRSVNSAVSNREAAYRSYVELGAYPFREEAQRLSDAVIGLHGDGCVIRLDGDKIVTPEGVRLSSLQASDLKDADGSRIDWRLYMRDSREEAGAPEFGGICRVYENYYYVDLAGSPAPFDLMEIAGDPYSAFSEIGRVYNGRIAVFLDDETHKLIYTSKDIDPSMENVDALGINAGASEDDTDIIEINGTACVYALSDPFPIFDWEDSSLARIALIVSIDGLSVRRIPRLTLALCMALLFFLTSVCWVLSAIRAYRNPSASEQQRKQYGAERMRRSVVALGLVGMLSVGIVTFFINCLTQLYTSTENNINLLNSFQAVTSDVRSEVSSVEAWKEAIYVGYAHRIANTLAERPELKTREALEEMCGIVGADYLMLYDDRGRETLSNAPYVNLTFSEDNEAPDSEFRKLLTGVSDIVLAPGMDASTRLERQLVGVSFNDGNTGDGYGALIMAMIPETQSGDMLSVNRLMEVMTPADGLCLAVDPETAIIMNASDPDLIGKNALSLGMTAEVLRGDIIDHFVLNGQRWYSYSNSDDGRVCYSAVRANAIYRRLPTVALSFGGCFLAAYAILALILLSGYPKSVEGENGPEGAEHGDAPVLTAAATQPEYNGRILVALKRLHTRQTQMTPERRTRFVFKLTAGIMLAALLSALQISADGRDKFFILYYVLNGKWTPGFNLFAFAKILIVSLGVILAVLALNLLTDILCALLQKRGETICRLISSFIQYFSVLAFVFSAFDSLGLDGRALLASVGILSLAVSMGAKDLVADVLSGITIAFSDEYQIDDYIDINGFRGWVQDIGIRSTALVNNDGNIKHFSNRDVKNILNLSRRNCSYTISITIAGDQSLKAVEALLKRELPRVGQTIPEVISGPEYRGVTGFASGGVTIAITAVCKEQNYGKVRRNINREIRLLLEENGIVTK